LKCIIVYLESVKRCAGLVYLAVKTGCFTLHVTAVIFKLYY